MSVALHKLRMKAILDMFIILIMLIVQIIIESAPISSSGHVALLRCLYGDERSFHSLQALTEYVHLYSLIIFLIALYPRWIVLVKHPWRTRYCWLRLFLYGGCASLLTLLIYGLGKESALVAMIPLWVGFTLSGCMLLTLRSSCEVGLLALRSSNVVGAKPFVVFGVVGLAQGIALIPGLSRMGITYFVARLCGISERHAFSWTCTLALPIFFVGTVRGLLYMTAAQYAWLFQPQQQILLLCATGVAGVVLWVTRQAMLSGRIVYLGWYLITLALYAFFACS